MKIEIVVKRPNGDVEVVEDRNFIDMNPTILSKIRKATKDAGKGDVIKALVHYEEEEFWKDEIIDEIKYLHFQNCVNEGAYGFNPYVKKVKIKTAATVEEVL